MWEKGNKKERKRETDFKGSPAGEKGGRGERDSLDSEGVEGGVLGCARLCFRGIPANLHQTSQLPSLELIDSFWVTQIRKVCVFMCALACTWRLTLAHLV